MKIISTIFLFLLIIVSAKAQPFNGNFENWTGTPEDPASWSSPNKTLAPLGASTYPVVKSTDAQDGTYAARLETKTVNTTFGNVDVPGVISTGAISYNISTQSPVFTSGQPVLTRIENVNFWYKYTPATGDSMIVLAFLTKYNTTTNQRDTVGNLFYQSDQAVSTYTNLSLPVNYTSAATPDSIMLIFSSSSSSPVVGSVLLVDEVSYGFFAGVKDPQQDIKVQVYPNPASSKVTFNVPSKSNYSVTFYDIVGAQMRTYTFERAENSIDISGFRNGIYFYEIKDAAGKMLKTGRLSIAH